MASYDTERLGKIFSDIERYGNDLSSMGIKSVKSLEDKKTFYSTSMLLFSIINRTIDLGEEVIAANNLGIPDTYKDIFFLLFRGKVINKAMMQKLSGLSHYRNLFSHNYQDFGETEVYDAFREIGVVNEFVKRVKAKIRKNRA